MTNVEHLTIGLDLGDNATTTGRWSDATVSGTDTATTSQVGVNNTQSMRFCGAAGPGLLCQARLSQRRGCEKE
tara:strand:- start:62 stop:280 length:219 start_codon:yes stop_codon:yes gene_type:complete